MPEKSPLDSARGSALQRFTLRARNRAEAADERCELCGAEIPTQHRHVLEVGSGQALCVCHPCSFLFDREAASEGRFKLIPDRRLYLQGSEMADSEWESLNIPVGMVFLLHSTRAARVIALYPGPMGTVESVVEPETWSKIVEHSPTLGEMAPDVEALLVNRIGRARQHFVVPIDECFRLVATIRRHWKGFGGGREVWTHVERFFEALTERSRVMGPDDNRRVVHGIAGTATGAQI